MVLRVTSSFSPTYKILFRILFLLRIKKNVPFSNIIVFYGSVPVSLTGSKQKNSKVDDVWSLFEKFFYLRKLLWIYCVGLSRILPSSRSYKVVFGIHSCVKILVEKEILNIEDRGQKMIH